MTKESKYISVEDAEKTAWMVLNGLGYRHEENSQLRKSVSAVFDTAPAADVRPVVLCRECKYSYDSVGGWCCSHGICVDCIVREDFFCADGEKREKS